MNEMALKLENSVLAGLATATLVYGVYQMSLPSTADVRSLAANNADVHKSEKVAEWTAAAIVSGVSLIAKDPTIFVIGGSVMVGLAWMHRHANAYSPTGQSVTPNEADTPRVSQTQAPQEYATPKAPAYEPTF